jgi:hypothetical protein
MTTSSLGKGVTSFPPVPPSSFLPLERESPRSHEVFEHGAPFELVPDGIRMLRTGHFEKFLEVLTRLPYLALEVALSGCNILLVRAVHSLVVIIAAGSNRNPSRCHFCPFLLPLAPFLAPLLVALDGAPSCFQVPFSHHTKQR